MIDYDIHLTDDTKAVTISHTTKGAASEVGASGEFEAGAMIRILGMDTSIWVGATAVKAQANKIGAGPQDPLFVKMSMQQTSFYVDGASGSTIIANQVQDD